MSQLMPPLKPLVGQPENDGGRRHVRFRMWQIFTAGTTLVMTGWFCKMVLASSTWKPLGVIAAITALAVAKHVLVAILMVGLEDPRSRK